MQIKEKNFVSAVIYVHNAEDRISAFLKMVTRFFQENFEHSEIICVNDCSKDGSVNVIREFSKNVMDVSISVLNMSYYHGLETAMNAGVDLSIGDFVFEFDKVVLDFEDDAIMRIYNRSLDGYDIVSASPERKQSISSSVFYFVFDKFADLNYNLNTESFRILSRRVINRISGMNRVIPYRKAIYVNCGLKTDNLKYKVNVSAYPQGKDKQEEKYRVSLAIDSLIIFTEMGYRFSVIMTSLMIVTALIMALYSIAVYLIGNPVAGWTTTILFLSFCFLGLFGILTVIIKYLQIIVNLIFKRKKYSFESIEKLTH